jgi:hypothetical protein
MKALYLILVFGPVSHLAIEPEEQENPVLTAG